MVKVKKEEEDCKERLSKGENLTKEVQEKIKDYEEKGVEEKIKSFEVMPSPSTLSSTLKAKYSSVLKSGASKTQSTVA